MKKNTVTNVCSYSNTSSWAVGSFICYAIIFVMVLVLVATMSGCGSDSGGVVGEPCKNDKDCEGFCLEQIEGEWLETYQIVTFPNGMCTDDCLNPGEWYELNMCLVYSPTGEHYLFSGCRNDIDCRVEDGYSCRMAGYDANLVPVKVCFPPGV